MDLEVCRYCEGGAAMNPADCPECEGEVMVRYEKQADPLPADPKLEAAAKRVAEIHENIQFVGRNLAERLESYTKAGGDAHSLVQATELFVRAIVQDILVRSELTK